MKQDYVESDRRAIAAIENEYGRNFEGLTKKDLIILLYDISWTLGMRYRAFRMRAKGRPLFNQVMLEPNQLMLMKRMMDELVNRMNQESQE